jgi:NADH-quinone oxidoreductase subunit E
MLHQKYRAEIDTLLTRYAEKRSAVLPLLYIAQDEYGHLTSDAIREVADVLDLPPTDVFEVVGFYSLFYDKPVGRWVVQVCDDVPCCYTGAEETISALKGKLGIRENQTTADGMFTFQRVKCLAACNRAPVVQANLNYIYNVTPEKVDALLRDLRKLADGGVTMGSSGRYAEDFELTADALKIITRDLGPIAAPAPVVDEPEKAADQEAASAPDAPAQEHAEAKIAAESPTTAEGTNIERPNPAVAASGEHGAQPANLTQPNSPAANPATTADVASEAAKGLREGEDVKKTDTDK